MDCLNRNDYDRDACLDYFQAYRDCKNTWVSVCCTWVAYGDGIQDILPDQAEKGGQTSWPSVSVRRRLLQ